MAPASGPARPQGGKSIKQELIEFFLKNGGRATKREYHKEVSRILVRAICVCVSLCERTSVCRSSAMCVCLLGV